MNKCKTYIAIDLKSFYASVECRERNRDPLTTNLVVADPSRTEKTICLAVSPSLKNTDYRDEQDYLKSYKKLKPQMKYESLKRQTTFFAVLLMTAVNFRKNRHLRLIT